MTARWLPLESNPAVMNKLLQEVGVPSCWAFEDVYGLEEELLAMVPQPVRALLLLFPLSDKEEEFRSQQEQGIEAAGQDLSKTVFFMKQYVGNACGTVALIHAVANNLKHITLNDGPVKEFIELSKDKCPEERGHALEDFVGIADAHDKLANEGQTATPGKDDKIEQHFITLINIDGTLYELDGRKKFPINHGTTTEESFLCDSANVCRLFMDRNPNENRFAVMALTKIQ
ncbi:Ubiquitin carboxyl-terminal hydrolase isozyme L3 [Armadillidium nasatum]|uniref:Ubiquitin carboxyl-terminal hydrolase n=1 Tax=Armadillidium nasatum TaxID=96803 RepID=A0A5N5SWS6_9CRUS|nr:Ubiquitin carboxyl-terminal hydrolase isozyme L3 [Armadillidium nasatum]